MDNLRKILRFILPYRRQLFHTVWMTLVLCLLATVPPLVTRAMIDQVFTRGDTSPLFFLGLLMFLIPILRAIFLHINNLWVALLGQRFVFDIRNDLYHHFLRLSLRFFGKHSVGKLVYRLMGDSSVVQNMLTGQTMLIASDLFCSSIALVSTFVLNWRMALVLLAILVVFVINFRLTIAPIRRAGRSSRQAYDRLSGGVQNRLVANMAVKTFGAEGRENREFAEQSTSALQFEKQQGVSENTFWMNVQLIQKMGWSTIYFLSCFMVLKGKMTYGDVSAFTAYAMQLLWPAVRLSQLVNQLQQVAISTDRLFEVLDEKPEIENCENPVIVHRLRGEVDLENIKFHYEEGKPVIQGISLHCNPGDTTAFIGSTGCGKSTILNLLMRFYDVTGGSIKLDGVDVRQLDVQSMRRQFGIVLQESLLFSISIRENIRYGNPRATEEEVIAAAKTAEIHDFIISLPDGYDTPVGDFGVELSVGQKQRINIARAICANPAILIMDEATSSLDSDSELAIQRAMTKVLVGRTSFVVAHRLSTIKNATRIVYLDGGKIKEMGTHEELMAIPDGRYHELYTKHMGKGVIEE